MGNQVIVYEHHDKLVTLYTYGKLGGSNIGRKTSFSFVPMAIVEGGSINVCYGVVQVGGYYQSTWDCVVEQLKMTHVHRNYWRLPEVRGTIRDALDSLHFMPSYGSVDVRPRLAQSVVQDLVKAHVMYTHLLMGLRHLGDLYDVTATIPGWSPCGRVSTPNPLRTWEESMFGESCYERRLLRNLTELVGVRHVITSP